ncbi:MAG: hypothetical protein AAGD14_14935 [Planctomycetota bacterium]
MARVSVLLCSQDSRLRGALPEAEITREGVEILERGAHDVVVIDSASDVPTVETLRSTVGARRREIFVVFVSDHVTTGDGEQAWRESVDLVVHSDDLARLKALIETGRVEKQRLYGRFQTLVNERGDG